MLQATGRPSSALLLFHAVESRSPWYSVAFGRGAAGSSVYGWPAGTGPIVVEAVGALVARVKVARRFRREFGAGRGLGRPWGQDP
jgi:hypothetical protein